MTAPYGTPTRVEEATRLAAEAFLREPTPATLNAYVDLRCSAVRSSTLREVREMSRFSPDDVTFLRWEAKHAREQHGDLIAESFDFDGVADRIESFLAGLAKMETP